MILHQPTEGLSAIEVTAEAVDQFDALVSGRIKDLKDRVRQSSSQTSQVLYLKKRLPSILRYAAKEAVPKLKGDSGQFYLDLQRATLYFSVKFKEKWVSMFSGLKLTPQQQCVAIDIFVLHELFHVDQYLTSPRHADSRDAQAVLRTVDYHADANAAVAHFELGWLREQFEQIECAGLQVSRPGLTLLSMEIQGILRAMEVFEYPMVRKKIFPARFLRYFTWHYQYHRISRFQNPQDITALQLHFEPTITIARLTGNHAVSKKVGKSWPNKATTITSNFLWIASPNRWAVPAVYRFNPLGQEKISGLFQGIFECDLSLSNPFFEELFDANRALINFEETNIGVAAHATSHSLPVEHSAGASKPIPKWQAALILARTSEELDLLIQSGVLKVEDIEGVTCVNPDLVRSLIPKFRQPGVVAEGTRGVLRRDLLIAGVWATIFDVKIQRSLDNAIAAIASFKPREKVEQLLGFNGSALDVSYGSLLRNLNNYHPDNRAGGSAILAALTNPKELRFPFSFGSGHGIDIHRDNNILVAGGPVGCRYSRIAFEFVGPDSKRLKRRDNPIVPLRWYGIADAEDSRVLELGEVTYYLEGEEKQIYANNWPLIDSQKSQLLTVQVGRSVDRGLVARQAFWLEDNYLTITRLPNFLSWRAANLLESNADLSTWPQLVILDGRNGLGTRGAELLTQPAGEEALRNALQEVGKFAGSAYQVLFKLTCVNTNTGFSRFTRIDFVDAHEVRMPQNVLREAHAYAQDQLTAK